MEAVHGLPRLVAVHGLKRSGKGTIASRLCSTHGYSVVKFSGALKDMTRVAIRAACPMSDTDLERCIEGDLKEVAIPAMGGKSARYIQQTIGTEYRDSVDTAMWTRMALAESAAVIASGSRVVIDDLRFQHEVDLLRLQHASLWMVSSAREVQAAQEVQDLPWDADEPPVAISPDTLAAMVAAMLAHCGLSEDLVQSCAYGSTADLSLPVLAGRTPAHCLAMLREVWLPLMRMPWTASAANTAVHVSERPLPVILFDRIFTNDSSISHLHAQVDRAMASGRLAA